jgi:hypothetical protein
MTHVTYVFQSLRKTAYAMAAIFADAAVFGYKAFSKVSSSPSYDERSVHLAAEAWHNWRPQVQNHDVT